MVPILQAVGYARRLARARLGGEPLLRADIPDLVNHVRDRGMTCVLTSNGLLVPRKIDRLRRLSTLVLSLDAAGAPNDEVRGQGVFAAVREAIAAAKSVGVALKLNAVLSAKTAPFLDALLDFVKENDLHITVNVMRSGAPDLWRDAANIRAEDAEVRRILERLAARARHDTRRRCLDYLTVPPILRTRCVDRARDGLCGLSAATDEQRRSGVRSSLPQSRGRKRWQLGKTARCRNGLVFLD